MANEKKRIEEIYHLALEKKNKKERSAYIDSACGDDSKLRASVEGLLQAHDKAGDFLEVPPFDPDVTLDTSPLTEGPGTIIGNYKLLEQIGEGGMAVVYMAEQEKPLRRRVALKIIKLGMDTKSVIARFEAERQALAVMDHPNIAKVFDAGTTETGRLYFVMELVRGVSISKYCDKNKLDTKERLDLFVQVCNAVQHAHQKGIIHRDIKPSNVMVTLHDGTPVPKVIDFGIAKATSHRLTEKTVFTRYAQMIGTPAYMSPEQAEMSGLDVDTRTDIYSLGVLLYELLTAATPFSEEQLREAGYLEMQRIIREEEPLKPSTKLSTLGDTLTEIAEHRKASPDLLQKLVRGDLDWIVMKTLEKDRMRRYDTVVELSADVERHLNSEPVLAAAPSVSYRLRKFVRRHRTGVVFGLLVTAALVIGLALATVGFVQASHERNRAVAAEAESVRQRDSAQAQRDRAQANLRLALEALDQVYLQTGEKQLSYKRELNPQDREFLQKVLRFYEDFAKQNAGDRMLRLEIAKAYRRVGEIQIRLRDFHEAKVACQQALALAEQLTKDFPDVPEYHQELVNTARSATKVAGVLAASTDPKVADAFGALELLTKAVKIQPKSAYTWGALGWAQYRIGNYQASVEALEKSIELQDGVDDPRDDPRQWWYCLAMAHWQLGHKDEAHKWYNKGADAGTSPPSPFYDYDFWAEAAALLDVPGELAEQRPSSEGRALCREEMNQRARAIKVYQVQGEQRLPVRASPKLLFRFGDPDRNVQEATLWGLGARGRPLALMAMELYLGGRATGEGSLTYEFLSLSSGLLEAEPTGNTWCWSPQQAGVTLQEFPQAPPPADTQFERFRQMRELAGRMEAYTRFGPTTQAEVLRLIRDPIHRYADPAAGLLDGGLFAFAHGDNPEIILLIEARNNSSSKPKWRYALARMGQADLWVSLDGREVWKASALMSQEHQKWAFSKYWAFTTPFTPPLGIEEAPRPNGKEVVPEKTDDGGQKTEDRRQRTEDRGQ